VNGPIPHFYGGELQGEILVDDKIVPETQIYELAGICGTVFQSPTDTPSSRAQSLAVPSVFPCFAPYLPMCRTPLCA
jgi:hypothetical protein